jgi:hypothetical protein
VPVDAKPPPSATPISHTLSHTLEETRKTTRQRGQRTHLVAVHLCAVVRIGPRNPRAQEIVTPKALYLEPHLGSCRRLLACDKMLEGNSTTGFEAVWSAASIEHASGGGSCLLCTFPRCGWGAKRGLSTAPGSYVPTYPARRYLLG